ncbi:MAG: hypothetical protein GY796_10640 [Chloroflexi bacterium]|nr:hypothetical protein [Chloroflexota bacterium]
MIQLLIYITMSDRPLWQLLIISKNLSAVDKRPLTCGECFSILEYLADSVAGEQVTVKALQKMAHLHLATCPDCRDYYLQQLHELEEFFLLQQRIGK